MLVSVVVCFDVQDVELLRFRGALVRECARAGVGLKEFTLQQGVLRAMFIAEVGSFGCMEDKVTHVLNAVAARREEQDTEGSLVCERFFESGTLVGFTSSTRRVE